MTKSKTNRRSLLAVVAIGAALSLIGVAAAAGRIIQGVTLSGGNVTVPGTLGVTGLSTFSTAPTAPGAANAERWGAGAAAAGIDGTALGAGASAGGADGTSVGAGSSAGGPQSTAYGEQSDASGSGSSAFGRLARATTTGATAFGSSALAAHLASIAFGKNSATTAANQFSTGSATAPILEFQTGYSANSAYLAVVSSSELLATTSGATVTTSGLIPAGVTVLHVASRVTTTVTTSSATDTFDVGDADPDRYGAAIAGAATTTQDHTDYTADPAGTWSASGREIVLDAAAAETFTAGAVRVTVWYTIPTAPGS